MDDKLPLTAYKHPRQVQPKYADEESSDNFYSFGDISEDDAKSMDKDMEKNEFYKSLCLMSERVKMFKANFEKNKPTYV